MRILLTNDDGIHAPGLAVLQTLAAQLSEDVWTVAPETEQSGAGHSLSLRSPLRLKERAHRVFSVNGTPTDCVLVAVHELLRGTPPDLVLSGVNRGNNLGEDVTYSGTIAAAMEGALLGIPSIALSQAGKEETMDWSPAEMHAVRVIQSVIAHSWPEQTLINVNFPECSGSEVKGVKYVPQGRRKIGEQLMQYKDPEGKPYYWIGTRRNEESELHHTDLAAIRQKYIAVTPLSLDLTDYKTLAFLSDANA